jgi:NADPH:quinone reductase-like Zn-dependent oxidoreductase
MTAHYGMVRLGYLKNGARVLVHAASGSVGVAAVQIAKKYGCEIFGTADLALQFLKDMGVHHVLHSRNNSFKDELLCLTNGQEVDMVINSLKFMEETLACVGNGTFLEIGKIGIFTQEEAKQRRPDVAYHHYDLVYMWKTDPPLIRSLLEDLVDDFSTGALAPLPVAVFPFDDAVSGFRYMSSERSSSRSLTVRCLCLCRLMVHTSSQVAMARSAWLLL